MKRIGMTLSLLCLCLGFAGSTGAATPKAPKSSVPGQVEIAFVLDTTGSMGGLIDGAKVKIWSIVNEIMQARPTPEVKVALVGYRDRGDDYVTISKDFTADIDDVYARLQKFQAAGGGDTPESVNQALHEAVTTLTWSQSKEVLKVIFLVGDAPPHMNYSNDVPYKQTVEMATKKDLFINTVQCGNLPGTRPIWQEIAQTSRGYFVALGQTGDMVVTTTPFDADLSKLNAKVGKTLIAYGSSKARRSLREKQASAEAAPAAVAADRLSYYDKKKTSSAGRGDLVDQLENGILNSEDVNEEALPQPMRTMDKKERARYIQKQSKERKALKAKISKLVEKRNEYLAAKRAEAKKGGNKDAFDEEVARMVRAQGATKGLTYMD